MSIETLRLQMYHAENNMSAGKDTDLDESVAILVRTLQFLIEHSCIEYKPDVEDILNSYSRLYSWYVVKKGN